MPLSNWDQLRLWLRDSTEYGDALEIDEVLGKMRALDEEEK